MAGVGSITLLDMEGLAFGNQGAVNGLTPIHNQRGQVASVMTPSWCCCPLDHWRPSRPIRALACHGVGLLMKIGASALASECCKTIGQIVPSCHWFIVPVT